MAEPPADAGTRPTETVVRRAGTADADALARVSVRAWAATYPRIFRLRVDWPAASP